MNPSEWNRGAHADPSQDTAALMERVLYEVKRVVVGQDRFLERVMVAMLAQGHLLPARPRLPRLADGWYLARAWLKPSSRQLMRSARQMRRAVAAIRSQRPAQTAFAYALGHPGVASGILGTTRTRSPGRASSNSSRPACSSVTALTLARPRPLL
jgi:aryl-alcohol dehydrogenase-like predicted oxidoreductase